MIEALLTIVLFLAIVLGLPSMILDLGSWF